MSVEDTKKLGRVVKNVFEKVRDNTYDGLTCKEEYAAQIIATGIIVAALIRKENEIYHDH